MNPVKDMASIYQVFYDVDQLQKLAPSWNLNFKQFDSGMFDSDNF